MKSGFIDVPGIMGRLHCSKAKVHRLFASGELTKYKLGRRTLGSIDEVDALPKAVSPKTSNDDQPEAA